MSGTPWARACGSTSPRAATCRPSSSTGGTAAGRATSRRRPRATGPRYRRTARTSLLIAEKLCKEAGRRLRRQRHRLHRRQGRPVHPDVRRRRLHVSAGCRPEAGHHRRPEDAAAPRRRTARPPHPVRQGQDAGDPVELRGRRGPDGDHPAGEPGPEGRRRQEGRVGRPEHEVHEHPGAEQDSSSWNIARAGARRKAAIVIPLP